MQVVANNVPTTVLFWSKTDLCERIISNTVCLKSGASYVCYITKPRSSSLRAYTDSKRERESSPRHCTKFPWRQEEFPRCSLAPSCPPLLPSLLEVGIHISDAIHFVDSSQIHLFFFDISYRLIRSVSGNK